MRDLDTSTVSDALDRLGWAGQCHGILPLDRSMRLCGPAYTVAMLPVGMEPGSVGDYLDQVPAGSVVVIDARGRTDATVWGDLLTAAAHRRRLEGTIIDGVCRDSHRSELQGFPIFSRGHTMRTGKSRLELAATGVPVEIGGVRVEPGDLILGDADGVVIIPAALERRVAVAAREIGEAEDRIRRLVAAGESLAEARRRTGYHALQDRR